ncbi:MAG: hypothetical protein Kow00129_14120 [Thermoleophilia bacterium]
MRAAVDNEMDVPVITLEGDIDHSAAEEIIGLFEDVVERTESDILLLDVSGVTFLDSGGANVFLRLMRGRRADNWVGLVNPSSNIMRLLDIIGITRQESFRVFADMETARRAIETHRDLPSAEL